MALPLSWALHILRNMVNLFKAALSFPCSYSPARHSLKEGIDFFCCSSGRLGLTDGENELGGIVEGRGGRGWVRFPFTGACSEMLTGLLMSLQKGLPDPLIA